MVKSYNFDPSGSVFVKHRSSFGFLQRNAIDVFIVECDRTVTEHTLNSSEARELAAHLMQAADEYDKADNAEKANDKSS